MPIFLPDNIVPANIADGRLSISSTVSLPQSGGNVTHANFSSDTDGTNTSGVIYYTPYTGNRISLYENGAWKLYNFDSNSSFSLTNVPANRIYDMFAFVNNGVVALEIVDWGINTEYNITGVTVGANTVITFTTSGTQPFAVGEAIEIQGLAGTSSTVLNNSWPVSAVGGTGTSRTVTLNGVNTTGLTYTNLGTIRKVKTDRNTGLANQDGVYVKAGDATRKYLGTFRTTGAGQLTQDTRQARFLWNFYNRRPRSLLKIEPTESWTYGTNSTWRSVNNNCNNRVEFVCGIAEDPVRLECAVSYRGPAPAAPPTEPQYTVINGFTLVGIGINRNTSSSHTSDGIGYLTQMTRDAYTSFIMPVYANLVKSFVGYNFACFCEYVIVGRAGTVIEIFSFDSGQRASGIMGLVWG